MCRNHDKYNHFLERTLRPGRKLCLFALALGVNVACSSPVLSDVCPAVSDVTVNIVAKLRYKQDSEERDVVDEDSVSANAESLRDIRTLIKNIGAQSDLASEGSSDAAQCIEEHLKTWAAGNGLLGDDSSPQARYVRNWTLASLSLSVYKLGPSALQPKARALIYPWMRSVARRVREDAFRVPSIRRNNHFNWSMLGIGVTGIIVGDHDLETSAAAGLLDALGRVASDGTIAMELRRGSRALNYHNFAAEPLVTFTAILASRGYSWREETRQRLLELVRLAADPKHGRLVIGRYNSVPQRSSRTPKWLLLCQLAPLNLPFPAFGGRVPKEPFYLGGSIESLLRSIKLTHARPTP